MEDADKTTQPSSSPPPHDAAAAPSPKSPKAEIPRELRAICERYGEDVIGMTLASGHTPRANELRTIYATDETVEHARTWLTERSRSRRWRERITFSLEILVVLLIGWEIYLGYQQEQLQSRNFKEQQQVLTNLQNSSAATAKTLASLQSTTELMNTTQQMQLEALKKSEAQAKRSAEAAEANASTASQSLHVSERAYVHMTPYLAKPPTVGEKIQCLVVITNPGHSPAFDMVATSVFAPVPASFSVQDAYNIAHAFPLEPQKVSVTTLASGQSMEQHADGPLALTQPQVDEITEGKTLIYLFATASYKDVFNQPHHTEICGFFQPASKSFGNCHEHNKSD